MNNKIPSYLMFALMIIGVLTFFMVFTESYDSILYVVYAYFGVAALLAFCSSLYGIVVNPKNLKGSLIGVGLLVAVLAVSYGLAGDEVLETYGDGITPTVSKLSDAGLISFYILMIGAVGSIIFSAVTRIIK